MPAEERIIAPRIVQPRPGRTLVLLLIVLAGLAVAAYLGYEQGRQEVCDGDPVQEDQIAWRQERVAEPKTGNVEPASRQAIGQPPSEAPLPDASPEPLVEDPSSTVGEPASAVAEPVSAPPPLPDPEPAADAASAQTGAETAPETPAEDAASRPEAQDGPRPLAIQDFRLEPGATAEATGFSFAVAVPGGVPDAVLGTIWIAVEGTVDGRPDRLRLNEASKGQANFVRMRFKQRQLVEGEFQLPADFVPKRVIVEAKPLEDDKYEAAAATFDWKLSAD